MVEIEIDGQVLEAPQGAMIIEVADAAGIPIPRMCYHKKLSIAANCRVCLVQIEKVGKPVPACATPVTSGMKVYTQSPMAIEAQRSVMEFLLINHPLDCPICDQAGQCELQDISMGYGLDHSRYTEEKRVIEDTNLGPLISTDMTRCIHCMRCVRFGEEIAGQRELGALGRGENVQITTCIEKLTSELSGNVIDLCPVGALTSKPFRFTARAWELKQHPSIAPHDAVGSNVYLHVRDNQVMRAVPKENESLNETWLSDRDRYSYTGIHSPARLQTPMMKVLGEWKEIDWQTALNGVREKLQGVLTEHSAENVAGLISPTATTEERYLWQKWLRALGVANIDHRLKVLDTHDDLQAPLIPGLSMPLADIEQADCIILVGCNVLREMPIFGHRVRKATLAGAKVCVLNSIDYDFPFDVHQKVIAKPSSLVTALQKIAHAVLPEDVAIVEIQNVLRSAQRPLIVVGQIANADPMASKIRAAVADLVRSSRAQIAYLLENGNTAGAFLAGTLPYRESGGRLASKVGLGTAAAFEAELRAYILFGIEPTRDCANPAQAKRALDHAELVVAFTPFMTQELLNQADILLPTGTFAETGGTFVNLNGAMQSFEGAIAPVGEARPGWKVLRVLGNMFDLPGFDFASVLDVRNALQAELPSLPTTEWLWESVHKTSEEVSSASSEITAYIEWPLYQTDMLLRHAEPLQGSGGADHACVRMNAQLAQSLGLEERALIEIKHSNGSVCLPLAIDNRVANGIVAYMAGFPETIHGGPQGGSVKIKAVSHVG